MIVITPAVLNFPEEYEYLKVQEIVLFVFAILQLIAMSLGVMLRTTLAKDNTKKTLWAATVFGLSVATLIVSIKNIGLFRQLLIFIMAFI